MKRLLVGLIAITVVCVAAEFAQAQVYQAYYPAPVTTYYAPGPVIAPAPTTVFYGPTPIATTRYRPLIGGTVTRWRYVNRPVAVYPTTTAYYPAW